MVKTWRSSSSRSSRSSSNLSIQCTDIYSLQHETGINNHYITFWPMSRFGQIPQNVRSLWQLTWHLAAHITWGFPASLKHDIFPMIALVTGCPSNYTDRWTRQGISQRFNICSSFETSFSYFFIENKRNWKIEITSFHNISSISYQLKNKK